MASSRTGFRRLLQPLTTIAWRVGVVVVVVVIVAISPLRLTGMHGHAGWWMLRGHEAVAHDVLGLGSCAYRALLAGIRFAVGWVGCWSSASDGPEDSLLPCFVLALLLLLLLLRASPLVMCRSVLSLRTTLLSVSPSRGHWSSA